MIGNLGSIVLVLWTSILFGEARQSRQQAVLTEAVSEAVPRPPICSECISKERVIPPTVGIDLTLTYGTVAVKYYNKTVVDAGRIGGGDDYKEMMGRLADPNHPKYLRNLIRWKYGQVKRQHRKARSLPSTTPDVTTLSNIILQLYELAASLSPEPVSNSIVLSIPAIPSVHFGDFDGAITYAGLTLPRGYKPIPRPISQVYTAFAAMQSGLSTGSSGVWKSEVEEGSLIVRPILTVSYTDNELFVARSSVVTTYWIFQPQLGFSHRPVHSSGIDGQYWTSIEHYIKLTAGDNPGELYALNLIGESAENRQFLDTLWKALSGIGRTDLYSALQTPRFSAEFMAARGAAEMAERAQAALNPCIEEECCRE